MGDRLFVVEPSIMRPDLYTKAVLTVIAVTLAVIAFKPLVGPQATVSAQSAPPVVFSGMQFSGMQFSGVSVS
jgi:hypothetical protein